MTNKKMLMQYLYEVVVLEDRKRFWEELRDKQCEKRRYAENKKNEYLNSKFSHKNFDKKADLKEVPDEALSGVGSFFSALFSPVLLIANPATLFVLLLTIAIVAGIIYLIGWVCDMSAFEAPIPYKTAFFGLCIVCYLGWIIFCLCFNKDSKKKREKIIEENAEKENALQEERKRFELKQNQQRLSFEENRANKLKTADKVLSIYDSNLSIINKELSDVDLLLKKYYATGVLYPTYHNFHAVLSILQYLQSGICEGLSGPDGAYSRYEKEVRMDTVIEQLKITNSLMKELVQNTTNILAGVRQLNYGLTSISNRLDRIQDSLLSQKDLMEQYNRSISENTSALYQINSNVDSMKSIEQLRVIQQEQTNALLEYQNFAIKQSRLNGGNYC